MRRRLHSAVRRWWDGEGGAVGWALSVLTAPLERLYRVLVRRRNRQYARSAPTTVPGCTVISVGNLCVGGTGKTPMAAWLVRMLAGLGEQPALLSRGYGEDEVLLHRRWHPTVPVLVDPDRVAAALRARAGGATVLVLDDGFQHRRIGRDVDVVLVAAEDPWPGRLLPRGPYREPPEALRRASAVIVTRRTADAERAADLATRLEVEHGPFAACGVVCFEPGPWVDLEGRQAPAPVGPVLAAAAIARPEAFALMARRQLGVDVELAAFPDHHRYDRGDARALRRRAGGRTLVVTEKDAVKLVAYVGELGPVRVLTQAIRWERGESEMRELIATRWAR